MTYVIYRCCNDECSEAWRGRWVEDTGETDPRCEGVVYMHHSDPRFPEGIDPGPTKAIRGWHGKDWQYNRAFVDGHAEMQKILIEGTEDSQGYYEHYRTEIVFPDDMDKQERSVCIIVRGPG